MYKTRNYSLNELAHPQIIRTIGERNTWRRLDEDCLKDLDFIRDEWYKLEGSGVYVNRLNIGIDSRGLRPPNDPDGSFYSTHKQGNTFDMEPVNGKLRKFFNFVQKLITDGKLRKINTLENFEDTLKWVHAGYMNTDKKPLIIYL